MIGAISLPMPLAAGEPSALPLDTEAFLLALAEAGVAAPPGTTAGEQGVGIMAPVAAPATTERVPLVSGAEQPVAAPIIETSSGAGEAEQPVIVDPVLNLPILGAVILLPNAATAPTPKPATSSAAIALSLLERRSPASPPHLPKRAEAAAPIMQGAAPAPQPVVSAAVDGSLNVPATSGSSPAPVTNPSAPGEMPVTVSTGSRTAPAAPQIPAVGAGFVSAKAPSQMVTASADLPALAASTGSTPPVGTTPVQATEVPRSPEQGSATPVPTQAPLPTADYSSQASSIPPAPLEQRPAAHRASPSITAEPSAPQPPMPAPREGPTGAVPTSAAPPAAPAPATTGPMQAETARTPEPQLAVPSLQQSDSAQPSASNIGSIETPEQSGPTVPEAAVVTAEAAPAQATAEADMPQADAPTDTSAPEPKSVPVQPRSEQAPVQDLAGRVAEPSAPPPLLYASVATTPVTSAPAQPLLSPEPQPLAEAVLKQTIDMAHDGAWLDQLARDIAITAGNDSRLRFQLNPEHLGSLHVEIRQGGEGASVRLTAESEQARQMLADAQPRLLAEARAQGVRIAEAQVDLSGRGNSSGQPGTDQDQRPGFEHARDVESERAVTMSEPLAARGERYA